MAKYISNAVANSLPPVTGDGAGEVLNVKNNVAVDTNLALGDLILFNKLPASHEPVYGNVYATDLDTNGAPTVAITVGILNDAGTDLVPGTEFVVDSAVGKAGTLEAFGLQGGMNLAPLDAVAATDKGTKNAYVRGGDRIVAGKVTIAGTTKAAGNVGVSFNYKAA